ncbi:prostaglandin E2 receptor EP4 subtype-like [Ruditapes philippinarum]|uniref:prostaglandin E2 receptor EP4 subtype-like n=1 Tax=Ruditapes philippinarum TaxID=129788 RepID=UPI00295C16D1|nr:prostaglandin E2 receptor EP4 subtype-like [Ruditapes philippinarum]
MCNHTSNVTDSVNCVTSPAGATIVSPLLMSLTGVLGNILALLSLYKARTDVRTTKFYSFIKGLAWTDLLGIVMTTPSVLIAYVSQRKWMGGDAHCRFHGFTMAAFGLATPLIICAMAIERFLALRYVFFYSGRCRTSTARVCILILWFGTILYGLLPLFGFGNYEKQYPGTWCYLDFHSQKITSNIYGYIYACTNLILILAIILCNAYAVVAIFRTRLRRANERVYSLNTSLQDHDGLVKARNQRKKSNDAEIQMIVLLCALTVVFTICWAPLMIRIIVTQATGVENNLLDLTAVRLASLNQTLDPWLYILLRRSTFIKIARGFKRIRIRYLKVIEEIHMEHIDEEEGRKVENDCSIIKRQCVSAYSGVIGQNDQNLRCKSPSLAIGNDVDFDNQPILDLSKTQPNTDSNSVCRLELGKVDAPKEEQLLPKHIYYDDSHVSNSTNNPNVENKVICYDKGRKPVVDNPKFPVSNLDNITVTEWNNQSGSSETKETTLSKELVTTSYSDVTKLSVSSKNTHERLRKTKSSEE